MPTLILYRMPNHYRLSRSVERGVQVEIIVPGRHIDTKVTQRASRSQWGPLLAAGAAIYEYQPTMYHCKVMVIDDCWVSVGSANFDNRSFRLNDEANLNAFDRELAAEQAGVFETDKQSSNRVTMHEWQLRPWREKAVEKVAGLLPRKSEQPHLRRSVLILFNNKLVWQLFAKCVAIAGVNGSNRLASNSP